MKHFPILCALIAFSVCLALVPPPAGSGLAAGQTAAVHASQPFAAGPNYDSGWLDIAPGASLTLTHNLNGSIDQMYVDLQSRAFNSFQVNNRFMGGVDFGSPAYAGSPDDRMGAYWSNLTNNQIKVTRQPEDTLVNQVRVRIWNSGMEADYSSDWQAIAQGGALSLLHNLGGSSDDYVVSLMFWDTADGGLGINQRAFGGRDLGSKSGANNARVGVYWYALTSNSITIQRRPEDLWAEQVLVRIWVRPNPTYDSGWSAMNRNTSLTLAHNINGSPDDYLVDMQFSSSDLPAYGVNQMYWGGNDFGTNYPAGLGNNYQVGAYWYSLTYNTVSVYRRLNDAYANKIRIRIWNFWSPTRANYDSGWKSIAQSESPTLTHALGGNTDDYLVDLQFKSSAYGINQRAYGGLDLQDGSPTGAYSHALTNGSILVFRRPEDTAAEQVRLRLWVMPKPSFDSGWKGINPGQTLSFLHNLKGNPGDYLVDVQFQGSSYGVNQVNYGGIDYGSFDPNLNDDRMGAYWDNLDESSISVCRLAEDIYIQSVRVRIWLVAQPDYNSGWVAATPGSPLTLNHNLGYPPERYLLNLNFQIDDDSIHQIYYGSNILGAAAAGNEGKWMGAFWQGLTSTSLTLYRANDDVYAEQLEARLWVLKQKVFIAAVKK